MKKSLELQVARWKAVVVDTEELLDNCVSAEDTLNDLIERCKMPQGTGRADLETSQEAIIRARAKEVSRKGSEFRPKRKTIQERKNELMELRCELAQVANEDPLAMPEGFGRQSVFQQAPGASPGRGSHLNPGLPKKTRHVALWQLTGQR